MASVANHVFNQYYWEFLKKVKDIARDQKYKADDSTARGILRAIKKGYMSFDKASVEHLEWFRANAFDAWNGAMESHGTPDDWKSYTWHSENELVSMQVYREITLDMIASVFRSKDTVLYYMMTFYIFAHPTMTDDVANQVLTVLRNGGESQGAMESVPEDKVKLALQVMSAIRQPPPAAKDDTLLSQLENTSLGKMAKEIIDEVNVNEIQESIGQDGDIMKAFADPNGGFAKLIGTISQKMMTKIASGDLTQDTLLKEAMSLTKVLPGFGGSGGGSNPMSQMANLFAGGGGDDDFDIASMMKNMMGAGAGAGAGKPRVNTPAMSTAMNRNAKVKQLRRKLEQRRKTKENVETQVGDNE